METPDDERREIEDYLFSQSGDEFEIEHVEKLTSEYVLGRQYDVWDAHTSEGRWWVITNPTNLYNQDAIKSMDVALSFHIGLMHRVFARQPARQAGTTDDWILDVLRRVDLARERLDTAREVEDFQSVGVRLREALVSLGMALKNLIDGHHDEQELKGADFKGWAHVAAEVIAAGADRSTLRGLLKSTSEKTWVYVSWLTHARRATPLDARMGCGAVGEVVELFLSAISQWRMGTPPRCRSCGSYQLKLDFDTHEGWFTFCRTCGRREDAEPAAPIRRNPTEAEPPTPLADEGKEAPTHAGEDEQCVAIEDFGIYLSPREARTMMEAMQNRLSDDDDAPWANFFTVESDGTLTDAHRVVFAEVRGAPSPAAELVYDCPESDICVNPHHATEVALPIDRKWTPAIIRAAAIHRDSVQLTIGLASGEVRQLFVRPDIVDTLQLADVSVLPERVIVVSEPNTDGWTEVVVGEQRSHFGQPSIRAGWLHPVESLDATDDCPCASGKAYAACHGARGLTR